MAKPLKALSGLDASFLYLESAGTPMHVGSVMLLDWPARRGVRAGESFRRALVDHLASRLPRAPALRRVLHEAPLDLGHPMWAEAADLDVADHVRLRALPGTGGRARLRSLVAKLHAQQLPRDAPLWQFVVIDNVEPGVVALYSKVHHALLDGQGGIALAQVLLDIEAKPAARVSRKHAATAPAVEPDRRDLANVATRATVSQFARLLRALPATFRQAGGLRGAAALVGGLRDNVLLAPRTVFNCQVGPDRSFAELSLPIDQVKAVARGFGVSLNDVVLAICAGALRELLLGVEALPRKALVAAMPVSLRPAGNTDTDNQVSMVQCTLATDLADPVARLRAIHASTAQIKQRVAAFKDFIPTDYPGLAAPIWAAGLSRLWARGRIAEKLPPLANVAISNVPGPPVPLYLAGAKVRNYFPVSIVTHGLAFNITVQSYDGRLEFGLTACKDVVARPEIAARAMARALTELLECLPHELDHQIPAPAPRPHARNRADAGAAGVQGRTSAA
jgi:WS/DGAT/MGAT family acyltransferase